MATNIRGRTTCHPSATFKLKCRREKEQLRAALALQLQKDMKRLLDLGFYSDITLTCNNKTIKAHSSIVRTRTPKFYEVYCCQDTAENSDDNNIHITDLSGEVLEKFVGDIYCNLHLDKDAFPASSYNGCLDETSSLNSHIANTNSDLNFTDPCIEYYSNAFHKVEYCKHSDNQSICVLCPYLSNMEYFESSQCPDDGNNSSDSQPVIPDCNANSNESVEQTLENSAASETVSMVWDCDSSTINSVKTVNSTISPDLLDDLNFSNSSITECSQNVDSSEDLTSCSKFSTDSFLTINPQDVNDLNSLPDLNDKSSEEIQRTENTKLYKDINNVDEDYLVDLKNQMEILDEHILDIEDLSITVGEDMHRTEVNVNCDENSDKICDVNNEKTIANESILDNRSIDLTTCSTDISLSISNPETTIGIVLQEETNNVDNSSDIIQDEKMVDTCTDNNDLISPKNNSHCKEITNINVGSNISELTSDKIVSRGAWWFSIDVQSDIKINKTETVSEQDKEKPEVSVQKTPKAKDNFNNTAFFIDFGNSNIKHETKPVPNFNDIISLSKFSAKQQTPQISPERDDDLETVYSEFSDNLFLDSSEMKHVDNQSQEEDENGSVYSKLGYCSKLGKDLLRMFIEEINTDVEIEVEKRKLKAHKCILCTRCDYFAAMLNNNWVESNGNIITLQGFSYNAVHFSLLFIYGGVTDIPDNLDLSELISLADMLGLEGLKDVVSFTLRMKYCHFFHKPCTICTIGVIECLPLAAFYGLEELIDKSLCWITKYLSRVWVTKTFASLPEDLLQKCFNFALSSVAIDTVIDMILECDRLITTLPQVKWSENISSLVSQLLEACVYLLSMKLTDVLTSPKFLALGKGLGWNVNIISESLSSAIRRFSPAIACSTFIQVNQLIQQPNTEWNEKFICMLNQVGYQCERLLIHNAGQVVRSKEWQLLSEDTQRKIKDAAIFVDDIKKPVAPPPKFSSLNRKFSQKRSESVKDNTEARKTPNKERSPTKSVSDLVSDSSDKQVSQPEAIIIEQPAVEKPNNRPKSWPTLEKSNQVLPAVNGSVTEKTNTKRKTRPVSETDSFSKSTLKDKTLVSKTDKSSSITVGVNKSKPLINKTIKQSKGEKVATISRTKKASNLNSPSEKPKVSVTKVNDLNRPNKTKSKTSSKK